MPPINALNPRALVTPPLPPTTSGGASDLTINISSKKGKPEQHADAVLATLGFVTQTASGKRTLDTGALDAYKRQHGVDLRQKLTEYYSTIAKHNHVPNAKGGFTASVPVPFTAAQLKTLKQFARDNRSTAAKATPTPGGSPANTIAARQSVDRTAQQQAQLNSRVPLSARAPGNNGIPSSFTPQERELLLERRRRIEDY